MRCTLLGGLCAFCLLLTISIVIILLSQSSSCPLGTFRCLGNDSEIGVCLPRRLLCDNRPDCPDGSDEDPLKCSDNYGELQSFVNVVSENPGPESTTVPATVSPFFANCSAKAYPRGCTCQNRTWLFCLNLDLMLVPQVEARLSRLVLMNNSIRRLSVQDLEGYDLEFIRLEDNLLEVIEDDALSHQRNLTKLVVYGKNVVATFFLLVFVSDNKESNNKEKETNAGWQQTIGPLCEHLSRTGSFEVALFVSQPVGQHDEHESLSSSDIVTLAGLVSQRLGSRIGQCLPTFGLALGSLSERKSNSDDTEQYGGLFNQPDSIGSEAQFQFNFIQTQFQFEKFTRMPSSFYPD
ncbi:hypothetical protein DAPPUDRAFT_104316 [Daphnia pulex]|uniref:Uncharacterized protein n=1 Tax=Daphnia pulex TaxID=6669 RepID=E9GLW6_DAPPU|nr:hypothetical protein DAPPUDRAFT_104316 [Daphnia pulex]|eukprot:EFX79585.1 hypothetical protein DAPPUDRAFT_104316 [Daphnia pulex]